MITIVLRNHVITYSPPGHSSPSFLIIHSHLSATTSRMTQDQMCGGEAKGIGWRDLGALHSAALTGMSSLPSRTQIYYIYGDSVTNVYSNETIFTTPLLPGERTSSSGANLKALLLCDLGRGNDDKDDSETWDEYGRPAYNTSRFAAARAGLGDVDLVFHGGDISYARGFEAVWDFWLNMISPLASRVLYLTTIGKSSLPTPTILFFLITYISLYQH